MHSLFQFYLYIIFIQCKIHINFTCSKFRQQNHLTHFGNHWQLQQAKWQHAQSGWHSSSLELSDNAP